MFIKLKHIHVCKLCKLDNNFSFEELVQTAREKFVEIGNDTVLFYDVDGTQLEKDVIVEYICSRTDIPTILIAKEHNNVYGSLSNASTVSVVSIENVDFDTSSSPASSVASFISDADEHQSLPLATTSATTDNGTTVKIINLQEADEINFVKPKSDFTLQDWTEYIHEKGQEIIDYYNSQGTLNNSQRIKLVNLTCAKLVSLYGIKVAEYAKRNLANAIITVFPNLKDPMSKYGYEAFYTNNQGGEGYISWRLRTIARTSKDGNIQNQIVRRKRKADNSDEEINVSKKRKCPSEVPLTPEMEQHIEFLKNASPSDDLEAIKSKMEITYDYRTSLEGKILECFPRLQDTPELIEDDFRRMFGEKHFEEQIILDADKILNIYRQTVSRPLETITGRVLDYENNWDSVTRAIFSIAYMIPQAARTRKNNSSPVLEDKIILFKKANIPINEVLLNKKTIQPFLIAQGSNKGAISQYHVVVDNKLIELPALCTSAKAFNYLFMSHFVFNTSYDPQLQKFWEFIQTYYFKIDNDSVIYTSKMSELRARLENLKQQ